MKKPLFLRTAVVFAILCVFVCAFLIDARFRNLALKPIVLLKPVIATMIPAMSSAPRQPMQDSLIIQKAKSPESGVERWVFVDQGSLKVWEEKVFKGTTLFKVVPGEGGGYLTVESKDACSGLYVKTKHELAPGLRLAWRWRVAGFPIKKKPELLSNRAEDDFGARIYAIFPGPNFFKSDVIEYIWDQGLTVGTSSDSPYSDRIKLMVIRSGSAKAGEWQMEERDLYEDYRRLFGRKPKYALGLIAIMSDSDNTGSASQADFADIEVSQGKV